MKIVEYIKSNSDLVVLTLLGLIIRVVNINKHELWFDEAFSGVLMRVPLSEFINQISRDAHPPFYNILLKFWTLIFGTSLFSLRGASVLAGVGIIIAAYILSSELFNKKMGAFSALLVAINPFLVGYSTEARSYSFYGLLAVLMLFGALKNKKTLFLITGIFLSLTHYVALIFVVLILAIYIYENIIKAKNYATANLLPLILVSTAVMITTSYAVIRSSGGLNTTWIREPSFTNIFRSITAYNFGVKVKLPGADEINTLNVNGIDQNIIFVSFIALYFGGAILSIWKIATQKQKDYKILYVYGLVFLPQIALILLGFFTEYKIYVERYLLPSAIFYLISISYILSENIKFEFSAALTVGIIYVLLNITPNSYFSGYAEIAKKYKNSGVEIAYTSPMEYLIGRYYFNEDALNLRLYDVQNPSVRYEWWPLIRNDSSPANLSNTLVVSPFENRVNKDYIEVDAINNFRLYKLVSIEQSN